MTNELEGRTKDLMSVRVESQYRYKMVCEKQREMAELKREKEKVEKQRDLLEGKRKNLEEGNKVLVMARTELEGKVREKNNELLEQKGQISEL